jgi:hypothetical protein
MLDDFRPIMPSLIRLIAGIIVLFAVQAIILGFPGITQPIPNSTFTTSSIALFTIGLLGAIVVVKFGTQLSNAIAETYKAYRAYVPLLAYFFQIAALWILYQAAKGVSASIFTSAPWAYPMLFLLLGLIATLKVVVNTVHALEGQTSKHPVTREQF